MMSLLIFLTFIVVVSHSHSFQQHTIQRLHKLYNRYSGHGDAGKESEEGESDCCAVCLCQVSKGERVRSLPGCNHHFHADCIGAWLKDHTTCPLCRNQVTEHLLHSHKLGKVFFRHSLIDVFQSFSDLLIALLYMTLPASIRESFPLVL